MRIGQRTGCNGIERNGEGLTASSSGSIGATRSSFQSERKGKRSPASEATARLHERYIGGAFDRLEEFSSTLGRSSGRAIRRKLGGLQFCSPGMAILSMDFFTGKMSNALPIFWPRWDRLPHPEIGIQT